MLKRIKSVSMLLALAGVSSTGAAYAVAVPEVDATRGATTVNLYRCCKGCYR